MPTGPMSDEHKRKISEAGKGRVVSEETKEKIRQKRLGSTLSDDHKAALALAAKKRWARQRGEDPDLITLADVELGESKPKRPKPAPAARQTTASVTEKPPKPKIRLTVAEIKAGRLDPSRFMPDPKPEQPPFRHEGSPPEPTVIDCQSFAGAFTLGATQAGFTLAHKVEEKEGFGMAMCEANRDLLGDWWDGQAAHPGQWDIPWKNITGIVGNPPCSGFSVMSPQSFRGINSPVNQCMHNLFNYACRVGPQFVVMESVTSAYKIGLPLMRHLAENYLPGYYVTHVMQNNLALGGCTNRKRYFLVVTCFPFGVESEPLKWLPTTGDAVGDLRNLELTWDAQPYDAPPTWWSVRQRSVSGQVDGHQVPAMSPVHKERLDSIITGPDAVEWPPGMVQDQVLKLYYETHGYLPECFDYQSQGKETSHLTRAKVLIDNDFNMGGYAQTRHWPWNTPGYVLTGHGPGQVWHPDNRHFTHREAARVMGFPDDWKIAPLARHPQLYAMWGKGISVDCGRWVCTQVLNSLNGNPGSNRGHKLPDGDDRLIDVSQDFKKAPPPAPAV